MFYWILIVLGGVAAIAGTALWKKEPSGTKKKLPYALLAYISFAIYLIGIIGQFESVLSQIAPPMLFIALILVPIIMFAIVFFERMKEK